MSTKKNGMLTVSKEWRVHLRKKFKRLFWKTERAAVKKDINKNID
jgi:hypothetical protein